MKRELPPITAPSEILAEARANVASRLRARGYAGAAEQVERDGLGWGTRHEVNRLLALRAASVEHQPV